jgi:predicted phosphodiesterase
MKIQVASDVHLEFFKEENTIPVIEKIGNVLALVGDIGYPSKRNYERFIMEHADRFEYVFVIAGNHEFYTAEYHSTRQQIQEICSKKDNVHFLDKGSFLYVNPSDSTDRIRILGCTLWSFVPDKSIEYISKVLNDYRCIQINEQGIKRTLQVQDTVKWHKQEVKWLQEQIELAEHNHENVVVLTHHAPLVDGTCAPRFNGSEGNYAFSTDLKHVMKRNVMLWAFGHTHFSSMQTVKNTGTVVASNQMGYRGIDKDNGYKEDWVFDVPSK